MGHWAATFSNTTIFNWKCELWLAKRRAFITVWKTWKDHGIAMQSWTVWRIYPLIKKTIPTFWIILWISTGYFIREIENITPCVPCIRYSNTRESSGELEIAWKLSSCRLVFLLQFLVLPNFHSCFYMHGNTENVSCFLINIFRYFHRCDTWSPCF